jgi:hypothetical protein
MPDVLIVAAPGADEAVARTLAALVEGVVAGAVGRVAILAGGRDPALARIAESVGCDLLEDPAALAGRGGWLVVLPAGALPRPGWPAVLEDLLRRGGPLAAALAFRQIDAGLAARLRWLADRQALPVGGLVAGADLARLRVGRRGLRWAGPVRRTRLEAARWQG